MTDAPAQHRDVAAEAAWGAGDPMRQLEVGMANSIYVGNLPDGTTAAQLRTLFGEAGEVCALRVLTDATTGASQGMAYIEYTDPAAVPRALALFHGYQLADQALLVQEAGPNLARQDRTWRARSEHPGAD